MRALAVVFVVTLLLGCGDGAPVGPAGDDLQLPKVGLLGDLPPAVGAAVITVRVDGSLSVNGTPCAWDEFVVRMDALTKPSEAEEPKHKVLKVTMTAEPIEEDLEEGEEDTEEVQEQEIIAEEPVIKDADITETDTELPASEVMDYTELSVADLDKLLNVEPRPEEPESNLIRNTDVLLRIDRRVPWAVVVRLLWKICEPRLRLVRTFYSAEGHDGLGEGAIANFLPVDMGCGRKQFVNADVTAIHVHVRTGEGEVEPERLAAAMLTRAARPGDLLSVSIQAPPEAPFGTVLTAVEAALLARARNIEFSGAGLLERSVEDLCAGVKDAGSYHLDVGGKPVTLRPERGPERAVRATGYVGLTNAIPLNPEPVIDDEELEDGDPDGPFK